MARTAAVAAPQPIAQWLGDGRESLQALALVHGHWRTRADLQQAVLALLPRVQQAPAHRWLLSFRDGWCFLVALLAVLHAGKVAVIPGHWPLAMLREQQERFDALLSDDAQLSAAFPAPAAAPGGPLPTRLPAVEHGAGLELFTSGSTGQPTCIPLSLAALDREIARLAERLGPALQGTHVVGSVTHQHRYGLMARILLPTALGLTWSAELVSFQEQLLAPGVDQPLAFISSPAFLKRLDTQLPPAARLRLATSAGGVMPAAAWQAAAAWLGTDICDIYGSTEQGGVAWRMANHGDAEPWRVFAGLRIALVAGEARLCGVGLPAAGVALGDRLVDLTATSFRLLGRADRIVKVEDKRVSLDEVRRRVLALEGVHDACVLVLERGRRAALAVAVVAAPGVADAADRTRCWRTALQQWLDGVAVPRYWRIVEALPTDSMGKHPRHALEALFEDADV